MIKKFEEFVGGNADSLVGKHWDELANLIVK